MGGPLRALLILETWVQTPLCLEASEQRTGYVPIGFETLRQCRAQLFPFDVKSQEFYGLNIVTGRYRKQKNG